MIRDRKLEVGWWLEVWKIWFAETSSPRARESFVLCDSPYWFKSIVSVRFLSVLEIRHFCEWTRNKKDWEWRRRRSFITSTTRRRPIWSSWTSSPRGLLLPISNLASIGRTTSISSNRWTMILGKSVNFYGWLLDFLFSSHCPFIKGLVEALFTWEGCCVFWQLPLPVSTHPPFFPPQLVPESEPLLKPLSLLIVCIVTLSTLIFPLTTYPGLEHSFLQCRISIHFGEIGSLIVIAVISL